MLKRTLEPVFHLPKPRAVPPVSPARVLGASLASERPHIPSPATTPTRTRTLATSSTPRAPVTPERVTYVMPYDSLEIRHLSTIEKPIPLLMQDEHRALREQMWKYYMATSDDQKREILRALIREISVHSAAEELCVYPILDHFAYTFGSRNASVPTLREQHAQMARAFTELDDAITAGEDNLGEEVEALLMRGMRLLEDHMQAEEMDIEALETVLTHEELQEVSNIYLIAKKIAAITRRPRGRAFETEVSLAPSRAERIRELMEKITECGMGQLSAAAAAAS